MDLLFETLPLGPTGNVEYGDAFTLFQQGTPDDAGGLVDEAGALTSSPDVGAGSAAPFVAWEFERDGPGFPNDPNSEVQFASDPGEGTDVITPAEFALVGYGSLVEWSEVELGTVDLNLYLGDFSGDGFVNHFDLALFIPKMYLAPDDPDYAPQFDLNGDWDDADEQIFTNQPLTAGVVNSLTFDVPKEALAGTTYARFRVSSTEDLSYDGPADHEQDNEDPSSDNPLRAHARSSNIVAMGPGSRIGVRSGCALGTGDQADLRGLRERRPMPGPCGPGTGSPLRCLATLLPTFPGRPHTASSGKALVNANQSRSQLQSGLPSNLPRHTGEREYNTIARKTGSDDSCVKAEDANESRGPT